MEGTILVAETVTTLETGSKGTTGSLTVVVVNQTASTSVHTARATSSVVSTRTGEMRVGMQLGHTTALLARQCRGPTLPLCRERDTEGTVHQGEVPLP